MGELKTDPQKRLIRTSRRANAGGGARGRVKSPAPARVYPCMNINLLGAVVFGLTMVAGAAHGQAPEPAKQATEPTPAQRDSFKAAADYSTQTGGDVLLIYMNGAKVFGQCGPGWSADKPHYLASGSKSFWGIAAMAAVQDGLLALDEKVADTI